MANDLETLFTQLGARHMGNGEWLFPVCPCCEGKDKMYFNINKLIGCCQKYSRTITLQMIARDLAGIPIQQLQSYIEEHAAAERATVGFRESMVQGLLGSTCEQPPLELAEIPLPEEFRTLRDGQSSVIGQRALQYLVGRGFSVDVLFELGFGYCDSGHFGDRVIVPFWEDGRLVYWQARDFSGKVPDSEKVLNPHKTPHGKSSVLFNFDEARKYDYIIVTESWGSALAVGRAAVGINGNHLSEAQLNKLVQTPASTIVIMLDHGKEAEAFAAAKRLSAHKRTLLAFLPYGDPNEVAREIILESLRSAKIYNSEDHIRQRVKQIT